MYNLIKNIKFIMENSNDFITSTENIFTEEASTFIPRTATVIDPNYQPFVNKDLVGDFGLLDENAKAVIWDETKKKVTVNGVVEIEVEESEEEEQEAEVLAAPVIAGTTPFAESTGVTITAADGANIYYTIDGSEPTSASTAYTAVFNLTASATVKAIAVKGEVTSEVASKEFTKE